MKKIMLFLNIILFSLLFTDCKKESYDPKQYLFDGLPYYLADTLFYTDGSSRKMLNAYDMHLDSKGFVWIRDFYWNLLRYDPVTEELIRWNTKEILGVDNPPFNFQDVFVDSRDRIWGAQFGGLYLIDGTIYKHFSLNNSSNLVWGMAEDSEGNLHFSGFDVDEVVAYKGEAYICDGQSIIQSDPVFATADYKIYKTASDKNKDLWYVMDIATGEKGAMEKYAVKYRDANQYTMFKLERGTLNTTPYTDIVFDRNNTPFFNTGGKIFHLNTNNKWEDKNKYNPINDSIPVSSIYAVDSEDNIWARIGKFTDNDPTLAILKDGEVKWIAVSPSLKVLQGRRDVTNICFPDNNTVWVCSYGAGVFVFKK